MIRQTEQSKAEALIEVRCRNCGRLLARLPTDSNYQIKCPKCHTMNVREKTE